MYRKKSYAVITGASSGIGSEFAKRLAAEGYNLILVARREDKLIELSREIIAFGGKVVCFSADLTRINDCKRLLRYVCTKQVSIFVNNAGFGDCGVFSETDINKDMDMIDLNVKALHYLTKAMLRVFKEQGYGYILNVASSAGLLPAGPYMATYYATKAYVTSLTRAIARELKEEGSRVYIGCLCPGPVDTNFNSVANVEFALNGITASYCANYAVDMMKKRQVVIVPTLTMKAGIHFGKYLPESLFIKITGNQQKKKFSN